MAKNEPVYGEKCGGNASPVTHVVGGGIGGYEHHNNKKTGRGGVCARMGDRHKTRTNRHTHTSRQQIKHTILTRDQNRAEE